MANVTITINGSKVEIPAGATILDAANKLNIHIPTLCYCSAVVTSTRPTAKMPSWHQKFSE